MSQALLLDVAPSFAPTHPAGDTPSWFTPLEEFLAWEQALLASGAIPRPFDLDPCGHPEAPVTRLIMDRGGRVCFGQGDPLDDGLLVPWTGHVVFFNPPQYDVPNMRRWLAKATTETESWRLGHFPAWPDRTWWHEFIERRREPYGPLVVEFLAGRYQYGFPGNPIGVGGDVAQFPSVNVFFRWGV